LKATKIQFFENSNFAPAGTVSTKKIQNLFYHMEFDLFQVNKVDKVLQTLECHFNQTG
jgi:hypothetical protein